MLVIDKKAKTGFQGFIGKVDESKCKPNTLWVKLSRKSVLQ